MLKPICYWLDGRPYRFSVFFVVVVLFDGFYELVSISLLPYIAEWAIWIEYKICFLICSYLILIAMIVNKNQIKRNEQKKKKKWNWNSICSTISVAYTSEHWYCVQFFSLCLKGVCVGFNMVNILCNVHTKIQTHKQAHDWMLQEYVQCNEFNF